MWITRVAVPSELAIKTTMAEVTTRLNANEIIVSINVTPAWLLMVLSPELAIGRLLF
jgi:hypothetical protein